MRAAQRFGAGAIRNVADDRIIEDESGRARACRVESGFRRFQAMRQIDHQRLHDARRDGRELRFELRIRAHDARDAPPVPVR